MRVHRPDSPWPDPAALLRWYDGHARALPWRAVGGAAADPYRVWLSEVMLQQTTAAAVGPRYRAWLDRFPTVEALAAADAGEVMAAWAGLGYYARARNLHAAARAIAAEGWPRDAAGLRRLPGVGEYTAGAVAAIAFGERAAAIDGNVERVMARVMALAEPPRRARAALRAALEPMVPAERPGDFAQALMDLGATVCTPRRPACGRCPWAEGCAARALGRQEDFPAREAKRARPVKRGMAWWLESGGDVLLVRRPAEGLLGGMRALPAAWEGQAAPPVEAGWRVAGVVRHGFTHFDLTLDVAVAAAEARPGVDGEWWPVDRLAEAGLPTLFARCAEVALAARASPALPLAMEGDA